MPNATELLAELQRMVAETVQINDGFVAHGTHAAMRVLRSMLDERKEMIHRETELRDVLDIDGAFPHAEAISRAAQIKADAADVSVLRKEVDRLRMLQHHKSAMLCALQDHQSALLGALQINQGASKEEQLAQAEELKKKSQVVVLPVGVMQTPIIAAQIGLPESSRGIDIIKAITELNLKYWALESEFEHYSKFQSELTKILRLKPSATLESMLLAVGELKLVYDDYHNAKTRLDVATDKIKEQNQAILDLSANLNCARNRETSLRAQAERHGELRELLGFDSNANHGDVFREVKRLISHSRNTISNAELSMMFSLSYASKEELAAKIRTIAWEYALMLNMVDVYNSIRNIAIGPDAEPGQVLEEVERLVKHEQGAKR